MNRPIHQPAGDPVTVVGAGISGLGAALALNEAGFSVTVLDKDPPLPLASPALSAASQNEPSVMDQVFDSWQRPGVTQLRHSHVFLARLRNLIRDRYPDLLEQLLAAGCRELRFADGLPGPLRQSYRPLPGDDDLTILSSRRTTLEYVLRRYVQSATDVTFENHVRVTGVRVERDAVDGVGDGASLPRLVGLEVERGPRSAAHSLMPTPGTLDTRLVVDASGRTTVFPKLLGDYGIELPVDVKAAGILYFTRHYRLRPGCEEPARGKIPGNGDLGYIKYGVFPADHGCFSITLALPEDEVELRKQIVKPESFDFICSQLPGVARFTDPERSVPTSKVFGMGNLQSAWRNYLDEAGEPRILGFYPVGDSLIRSNPLYGRGCSSGVLAAHLLADALQSSSRDDVRLKSYLAALEAEIRPHFDSMRRQDLSAIKRAQNEKALDYRPSFKARLARRFIEDALAPTLRGDLVVLRAFMPGFHMLAPPDLWLKRPGVLLRIVRVWLRGRRRNRARGLYLPELGPRREAMCRLLGADVR